MTENVIDRFEDEYYFLSNFYNSPVEYSGIVFRNNEAAFQAAKCPDLMVDFRHLDPSTAKKLGRRVNLRKDWEDIKDQVMYDICKAKFTQNEDLKKKLLETGDSILIEGNWWGDKVWGVCNGVGENRLGKILMRIREELKAEELQ